MNNHVGIAWELRRNLRCCRTLTLKLATTAKPPPGTDDAVPSRAPYGADLQAALPLAGGKRVVASGAKAVSAKVRQRRNRCSYLD